ncbi:MAG: HK97 family phage prohead protease [Acidobacteriia bacterium]|nr:HK97 family phage prohead protease [Terriglobia bacterium]
MPNSKIERRNFINIRAESQGEEFCLIGYAALYNVESRDLGGFREIIQPGAFDRSLSEGDEVYFAFQHDPGQILARTSNGTLALSCDDKGLRFKATLNRNIGAHRDVYESCKSGLYTECSFGFMVRDGGQKFSGNVRTLTDVKLVDCSLVGVPAYPNTSASARSAVPTTQQLKARLAKLGGSVFATEDEQRRAHAEKLGKQIDGQAVGDGKDTIACERSLDDKGALLDALQDLADERYGPRYRVVDADCSEGSRCGTAIMRDMLSDAEDFYGVDYEEDEPDEDDLRSLNYHIARFSGDLRGLTSDEISAMRKLRFTSYRRKMVPSGTAWSKAPRAVRANEDWFAGRSERDLKWRMESASR